MSLEIVNLEDIPELVAMRKLLRETKIKNIRSEIDKKYNELRALHGELAELED